MTTPRISRWTADEAQLALAADLYADAFAEPPYAEDPAVSRTDLLERAPRYVRTKPHGRMLLAWQGEEIIGLALGTGIGPGDWWHDRVAPLLDRSVRERWLGIASGLRLTPDGAEFTLMGRDLPPAEPPRASAER